MTTKSIFNIIELLFIKTNCYIALTNKYEYLKNIVSITVSSDVKLGNYATRIGKCDTPKGVSFAVFNVAEVYQAPTSG
jgi:hypothetical protein